MRQKITIFINRKKLEIMTKTQISSPEKLEITTKTQISSPENLSFTFLQHIAYFSHKKVIAIKQNVIVFVSTKNMNNIYCLMVNSTSPSCNRTSKTLKSLLPPTRTISLTCRNSCVFLTAVVYHFLPLQYCKRKNQEIL